MNLARRQFLSFAGATVATAIAAGVAPAQTYPARPVRVIVPAGRAGPTDVTGRLIAQKLSERLGKQFYVENIGGSGGNIGMARAAQAAPDCRVPLCCETRQPVPEASLFPLERMQAEPLGFHQNRRPALAAAVVLDRTAVMPILRVRML
jgi:hypothetical protein